MLRTLPSLSATLALASLAHAQAVPSGQDKLPPAQSTGMVAPLPPQGPLDQVAGQPNSQGTTFVTPGMPTMGLRVSSGQVTRFSNEFNPAFSFIIDSLAQAADNDTGTDGTNVELLSMELAANAWVDPNAWAYFVAVLEDESLAVEEAAIHYTGFGDKNRLRAGRFFIDFGKQMQVHVHELRTLERPLALRAFLGAEIKGDGLQWDSWTTAGDSTAIRWSLGAFASTLPELDADADPAVTPVNELASPKHGDDFNFTARLTGFTEVGERGTLQLGTSARFVPNFEAQLDGATIDTDLSNTVYGLDATFGWVGETGVDSWTVGGELLLSTGDTGVQLVGPNPANAADYSVNGDSLLGYFAFAEYAWNRFNAVGTQFSQAELGDGDEQSEVELYYTRMFSEFHRLRFVLASNDSDFNGTSSRVALQYTAVLGAHGHGVNW